MTIPTGFPGDFFTDSHDWVSIGPCSTSCLSITFDNPQLYSTCDRQRRHSASMSGLVGYGSSDEDDNPKEKTNLTAMLPCRVCAGTGRDGGYHCGVCHGSGKHDHTPKVPSTQVLPQAT